MILKKKEFFLFIFLILLQSCSGGRIGNFLESSFNDLEQISKEEDLQKSLINKKTIVKDNKEIDKKNNEKTKKVGNPKSVMENKKDQNLEKIQIQESKKINEKINEKTKKVENPKSVQGNKKDQDLEKTRKQKSKKIKNSSKIRKSGLQSYKIIFILKDVDPKDPTEELSTILRNSEVNFEIEKIERILDSQNKSMNKN